MACHHARFRRAAALGALVVAVVATFGLAGCSTAGPARSGNGASATPSTPPSAEDLAPSQVKQFHGKKLDSITVLHENSIKGPQYVDANTYHLVVDGLVAHPLKLPYASVLNDFKQYRKVVRLDCVEGWSATILWQGPLVNDVLTSAAPTPAANTVIFHAVDGYSTSFPLDYFRKNARILAGYMNGQPLAPERGFPFMLVAEDKWGYKWCKWIDRIELSSDSGYRGYWEQRGYSNDGSRTKPFFGP